LSLWFKLTARRGIVENTPFLFPCSGNLTFSFVGV
jgi:hypothetical protein